jgi:cell fate regulator YaaT (PSP1 superfamily)
VPRFAPEDSFLPPEGADEVSPFEESNEDVGHLPSEAEEPIHDGWAAMREEDITFLKSHSIDDDALLEDYPEYDFGPTEEIKDIVGVKMLASGPVMFFDCQNMYLVQGDEVLVETGRGMLLGQVVVPARRMMWSKGRLPRVVRRANDADKRINASNLDKEGAAYRLCKDRINRLGLPMKLIRVEYLQGGNKAVFYFASEVRVDFRELVRDLARRLHTRIEMRQVGVRDASRMLGGVGTCGCQLCCNLYLREFQPVSIRMAKDQNLVLNPQKVSGVCGRLLCCLMYEDEVYRSAARGFPKVGRRVITPDGEGRIRDRDVLKRMVRVQLVEENSLKEYCVDQIKPLNPPQQQGRPRPEPEEESIDSADADFVPEPGNDVLPDTEGLGEDFGGKKASRDPNS